jgi:hypothetical protein
MQCACAILSSVACPALQCISTVFLNWHNFWKRSLNIKCVFWFSLTTLVWNISHSKKWERYNKNVYWSSCIVPEFLSGFTETWIFLIDFWKILKYQISWNPPSWSRAVPCSQKTNRHDEANSCFHNFANMPKKVSGNWMPQIFYK